MIWDADSRARIISTAVTSASLYSVCWSPRGDALALACEDSTIRIIDPLSGRQTGVLEGHILSVTSVCFDGTGTFVNEDKREF
jgi:WD40 repeat protein